MGKINIVVVDTSWNTPNKASLYQVVMEGLQTIEEISVLRIFSTVPECESFLREKGSDLAIVVIIADDQKYDGWKYACRQVSVVISKGRRPGGYKQIDHINAATLYWIELVRLRLGLPVDNKARRYLRDIGRK